MTEDTKKTGIFSVIGKVVGDTKNLLIVVLGIVLIVAILAFTGSNVKGLLGQEAVDLSKNIEMLNKTITDLQTRLETTEQRVKQYDENLMNLLNRLISIENKLSEIEKK